MEIQSKINDDGFAFITEIRRLRSEAGTLPHFPEAQPDSVQKEERARFGVGVSSEHALRLDRSYRLFTIVSAAL